MNVASKCAAALIILTPFCLSQLAWANPTCLRVPSSAHTNIERDIKGELAGESNDIIKKLIKEGKVIELVLDCSGRIETSIKAYEVMWVEDYEPDKFMPIRYRREAPAAKFLSKSEQQILMEWIESHFITSRGYVRFRAVLDEASLGWDERYFGWDEEGVKHAHIAHAGYRDRCIYIGLKLLKSILADDAESRELRKEILGNDEYRHLVDRRFNHADEQTAYKERFAKAAQRCRHIYGQNKAREELISKIKELHTAGADLNWKSIKSDKRYAKYYNVAQRRFPPRNGKPSWQLVIEAAGLDYEQIRKDRSPRNDSAKEEQVQGAEERYRDIQAKLSALAARPLEYGLIRGSWSAKNKALYDVLTTLFIENGIEADTSLRLADTLAGMKKGSLETLCVFGLIGEREKELLAAKRAKAIKDFSPEAKRNFAGKFQRLLRSYDNELTPIQKKEMMKRLVPLEAIEYFSRAYYLSWTEALRVVLHRADFPIWFPRAYAKVAQIEKLVTGRSIAWRIVMRTKIDKVDDLVRSALSKVNKIKDKVNGESNAWLIVMSHKLDDIEEGVDAARIEVEKMVKSGISESRAWRIAISRGLIKKAKRP